MKNPFIYRFKKNKTQLFFWFGLNYSFTIFTFEFNNFYHYYNINILGLRLLNHLNYEAYKKEIIKYKMDNNI